MPDSQALKTEEDWLSLGGLNTFPGMSSSDSNLKSFELLSSFEFWDLVCNSMPCSAKKLLKAVPFAPWEGWRGSSSTCVAACELVKVVGTKLPRHWTRLPVATAAEVNDGNACSIADAWNGHSCPELWKMSKIYRHSCDYCSSWWTFRELDWPPVKFTQVPQLLSFSCAYFLLVKQVHL